MVTNEVVKLIFNNYNIDKLLEQSKHNVDNWVTDYKQSPDIGVYNLEVRAILKKVKLLLEFCEN